MLPSSTGQECLRIAVCGDVYILVIMDPQPVLAAAGPGKDAADHFAAGLPPSVPRHQRATHGHRAQVYTA